MMMNRMNNEQRERDMVYIVDQREGGMMITPGDDEVM